MDPRMQVLTDVVDALSASQVALKRVMKSAAAVDVALARALMEVAKSLGNAAREAAGAVYRVGDAIDAEIDA